MSPITDGPDRCRLSLSGGQRPGHTGNLLLQLCSGSLSQWKEGQTCGKEAEDQQKAGRAVSLTTALLGSLLHVGYGGNEWMQDPDDKLI